MLNKWSLKSKLLLLCAGLISVSILVGAVGRFTLNGVTERYASLVEKTLPKMNAAANLYSEIRNYRLYLRTLVTTDLAAAQKIVDKIATIEAAYDDDDRTYQALGFAPGQKEIYEKAEKQWAKIKDFGHKVVELYAAGKNEELKNYLAQESQLADEYRDIIKELLAFHKQTVDFNVAFANSAATAGNTTSTVVILLGAFFGMLAGFLFSAQIAKVLNQLASGLARGAEAVAAASSQISNAGTELASAATEQAASLQETVASVEEISAMVARNSENATNSTAVAAKSRDAASRGRKWWPR